MNKLSRKSAAWTENSIEYSNKNKKSQKIKEKNKFPWKLYAIQEIEIAFWLHLIKSSSQKLYFRLDASFETAENYNHQHRRDHNLQYRLLRPKTPTTKPIATRHLCGYGLCYADWVHLTFVRIRKSYVISTTVKTYSSTHISYISNAICDCKPAAIHLFLAIFDVFVVCLVVDWSRFVWLVPVNLERFCQQIIERTNQSKHHRPSWIKLLLLQEKYFFLHRYCVIC